MNDTEIFESIGQLLFNESPKVDGEIHAVSRIVSGANEYTFWTGNSCKGNTFTLSSAGSMNFNKLLNDLHAYYVENELGVWNVMHFVVHPEGRFSTSFEFSEDLEKRQIPFWKYLRKFD